MSRFNSSRQLFAVVTPYLRDNVLLQTSTQDNDNTTGLLVNVIFLRSPNRIEMTYESKREESHGQYLARSLAAQQRAKVDDGWLVFGYFLASISATCKAIRSPDEKDHLFSLKSLMSDVMDSTRSSKYFPLPDIPNFGKSALTPSLGVLATHPRYRDALRPYEGVQWEVVQNMADLFTAWEDIAERYVNVDPTEDTEVDIMTGDTLYKGEKIEVEEEEDDPYEDEISSSDADGAAGSRRNAPHGNSEQAEEDDDVDELGFWGPESGIELQFAGLPDLTALTVAKGPTQAELDAFLSEQSEVTRLQEASASERRLESDDRVEDEIIVVERDTHWRSESNLVYQSESEDTGSPFKKRRVRGSRKAALQPYASFPNDVAGPSSDAAQICSDALGMDVTPSGPSTPFRTPKRAMHRARRGRPSTLISACGRTAVSRNDDDHMVIGRTRLDYNLVQSETITPYVSRSSRIVKQPLRWGAQIPWSQLRKNAKLALHGQSHREVTGEQECFVDLPHLPSDWHEYSHKAATGSAHASSPIAIADRILTLSTDEVLTSSDQERETSLLPASQDPHEPFPDEPECLQDSVPHEESLEMEADHRAEVEMLQEIDFITAPQDEPDTQTILIPESIEAMPSLSSPLSSCPPSPAYPALEIGPSPQWATSLPALPSIAVVTNIDEIDELNEGMEPLVWSESAGAASGSFSKRASGRASKRKRAVRCDDSSDRDGEAVALLDSRDMNYTHIASDLSELQQSAHPEYENALIENIAEQAVENSCHQSPPPIYCKFEAIMEPDDDPLNANTMDTSLDELNLATRYLIPISVRLPVGAKGAAFENPILIDEYGSEDELGEWDDVGW